MNFWLQNGYAWELEPYIFQNSGRFPDNAKYGIGRAWRSFGPEKDPKLSKMLSSQRVNNQLHFCVTLRFLPPTYLNTINWWLPLGVHPLVVPQPRVRWVLDPYFLLSLYQPGDFTPLNVRELANQRTYCAKLDISFSQFFSLINSSYSTK
jgi:hypothetical protein